MKEAMLREDNLRSASRVRGTAVAVVAAVMAHVVQLIPDLHDCDLPDLPDEAARGDPPVPSAT